MWVGRAGRVNYAEMARLDADVVDSADPERPCSQRRGRRGRWLLFDNAVLVFGFVLRGAGGRYLTRLHQLADVPMQS